MNGIKFYDPVGPTGWLSTFSEYPIIVDGITWPTVEHYYQAQKFVDPAIQEQIRTVKFPGEAKAYARAMGNFRREDWAIVREAIMLRALSAKFRQHAILAGLLRQTNGLALIENAEDDEYWGIGARGLGRNRLGVLLMKIRDELVVDE